MDENDVSDVDAIGAIYQPTLPLPPTCANGCEPAPVCTACSGCSGCCDCVTCDHCDALVRTVCDNCGRCDTCCECARCARSRCLARVASVCSRCDHCDDCCECYHCTDCGDPCESTCSRCDECHDCCDCAHCRGCNEPVESTCGDCDRCDDCCRCDDCEEDGENAGRGGCVRFLDADKVVFHRAGAYNLNPVRRYIGVELEIAGVAYGMGRGVNRAVAAWNGAAVVHDGSLPSGGFEINTPPARGDTFVRRIEALCEALNDAEASVTTACGMHVHVDARDLSYLDIQTLIQLYARVEPAMFQILPPSRKNSDYCRPCGAKYLHMGLAAITAKPRHKRPPAAARADAFEATLYGVSGAADARALVAGYKSQKYNRARYNAMNLHSWLHRGTVEFRHAAGTTQAEKVVPWATTCAAMVEWARRHRAADIDTLPADPFECLLVLAPTDAARGWLRERHVKFRYR